MKSWDYTGNYLEQFEARFRGAIGNLFCLAIRHGKLTEPNQVLRSVESDLQRKISYGYDSESGYLNDVIWSLKQDAASEFAEHLLWRENLPESEKQKLKDQSKTTGAQNFMQSQPPTDKQLSYLKSLGCNTVPENKAEASKLIDECLKRKAA